MINKNNFYLQTAGVFSKCEEITTTPDYVSFDRRGRVSSKYWYTSEGVVRASNHWGYVASCNWVLKGVSKEYNECEVYNDVKFGFCSFENFNKTTALYQNAIAERMSKLCKLIEVYKKENNIEFCGFEDVIDTKESKILKAELNEKLSKIFEL